MSVAIRMAGGLGNILFQLAMGETWRKQGYDVVYTGMDENLEYNARNYSFKRHTDVYKTLFEGFHWDEHKAPQNASFCTKIHVPFVYTEIRPVDGYEYIGYFQSEKFFTDKEYVRNIFTPASWLKPLVELPCSGMTCSVHVRRQDYLNLSDYHTVLPMTYYEKAIEAMVNVMRVEKFLIFSDDLDWCRENFIGDDFIFMDSPEYVALFQMGATTHGIIANSSLSWWANWRVPQLNRLVVTPSSKDWFGHKGADARDLIPWYWSQMI